MTPPSDASSFRDAYDEGAPWDIGRPQGAIVRAAESGVIQGDVLDLGCGKGDNALFLSQAGHYVWGVDIVEDAVETARRRAAERSIDARFFTLDAFELDRLDRRFDTVVDSGLFHVFDPDQRDAYVDRISSVLHTGGRLVLLCFSDLEPGDWGPHRVSENELRATFARGWTLDTIQPSRFELADPAGSAHAWLCVARPKAPV